MRISDWSSDVCSSDLGHGDGGEEIEGQGLNDHAAGLLSVSRPLRPWPAAAPVLSISCTGNPPNISCDAPSRPLLSAVGRIELQALGDLVFPSVAVGEQPFLVVEQLLARHGGDLDVRSPEVGTPRAGPSHEAALQAITKCR